MHYVIIGNGVAGINAANQIRSRDEEARISLISFETDHFFSRPALMYIFSGQLSERCVEPYERGFYERMNYRRIRDRVMRIIPDEKKLRMQNGEDITFDKLLIASGSLPLTASWSGEELDGVGHFVTWQHMEWLREKAQSARKAVIIGGGLIGIETAEILLQRKIETTMLVREEHFWPIAFDKAEGTIIGEHMRHHGLDLRLTTEMERIIGENGRVVGVETRTGERIDCDLVVITIGVRPQTDFLMDSDLKLDERGGIIVNYHLQTSLPDVWAAGDCTSVVWFNGILRPEQLWYTSRDQGTVAGKNMCGDQHVYERGIFYNSAKFFDIEYTTAGYVNFGMEGEQNWYQHEPGSDRAERITFMPDGTVIGFNMLGRRWDHQLMVRWIEQRKHIEWVLLHLHEALFEEEFMPTFQVRNLEAPKGVS